VQLQVLGLNPEPAVVIGQVAANQQAVLARACSRTFALWIDSASAGL